MSATASARCSLWSRRWAQTKAEKLGGRFYLSMANMLLGNRGYGDAWRLQYLSDLDKLPDYEEGYYYGGGRGIGAPVNADGTPVYYLCPRAGRRRRATASAGAGRSTRPPRSSRR